MTSTPGGPPHDPQAHRVSSRDRGVARASRPAAREVPIGRDLRDPHELRRIRDERQRGRVGGGGALGGLLRLGAFIAILAVVVIVVGATVSALILIFALQSQKRRGTQDPRRHPPMRG